MNDKKKTGEDGAVKKKRKKGIINTIFGGGIFTSDIVTRNALLWALIILYSFIYVSNRYEYEQELVRIDRLTKEKNELRNTLLTLQCELAIKSRQTKVEELLEKNNSTLKTATKSPYIIEKE